MSVPTFEHRFIDPSSYSTISANEDGSVPDSNAAFADSNVDVQNLVSYNDEPLMTTGDAHHLNLHSPTVPTSLPEETVLQVGLAAPPAPPSPLKAESSLSPVPPRAKPVSKPEREATKNSDGKYQCTWENCTEEVRSFSRRCEFNKHMDKHDRPYKCQVLGCEKLPGFTYSGGLLRHEREVHGLYGGPRNPLHCPHINCKRHSGKGFSRQENLNEHLRRVHTQATPEGIPAATSNEVSDGEAIENGSAGHKRKRSSYDEQSMNVAEELRKLRVENQKLKEQIEAQTRQSVAMMNQINELRSALGTSLASSGNDMI